MLGVRDEAGTAVKGRATAASWVRWAGGQFHEQAFPVSGWGR